MKRGGYKLVSARRSTVQSLSLPQDIPAQADLVLMATKLIDYSPAASDVPHKYAGAATLENFLLRPYFSGRIS